MTADLNAHQCTKDDRLLFLHIPKNAGTAIEDAAMEHGIRWGRNMDFEGCNQGSGNCFAKWHEPPAFMNPVNIYTNTKVFCVVRNPFSRVVSEYKYVFDNPEYRWENYDLIDKFGCTAKGLNIWVREVLASFRDGNLYEQLCHMLPQSYYIWGPPDEYGAQSRYCHEVIRFEDFPQSFDNLMQRYNYDVRLPEHRTNKGGCSNLTPNDLDSENIQAILEVYASDFKWLDFPARA